MLHEGGLEQAGAPSPRSVPLHPLAKYLLSLTVIVAAYFAYLRLAVPYLEPPPEAFSGVAEYSRSDLIAPPIDKSKLVPLLPEAAWELADCKSLLTESGTILFQELVELPEGAIEVKPFTLIAGLGEQDLVSAHAAPWLQQRQPRSAEDVPTVLRCQAGAKLTFDKPLREAVQGSANLKLARLVGEVEIFRPPLQADRSDEMYVYTRNVQVEVDRILTLDQVQIFYGRHRALGRNLQIDLRHSDDVAPGHQDFGTIRGARRMELAFLDHLRLEPSPKANAMQTGEPAREGLLDQNQSPIEVRCQGPFVFDFERQVASFQDQVVARQLDEHQDRIECARLELEFQTAPTTEANSSAPPGDVARFKRLVATGAPAVVTMNSRPTRIVGQRLSYNAQTREFEGQATDPDQTVSLVSTRHQIVARHLRYTLTADGSLGPIAAEGPGRLMQTGSRPEDEVFIRWSRRLLSRQDPKYPDLQSIVLDGQAQIRSGPDMQIAAERVTFHVRQWQEADGKWQFLPAQAVAVGDVEIQTDRLQGFTEQLTARWRRHTPGTSGAAAARVQPVGLTYTAYRRPMPHPQEPPQTPAQENPDLPPQRRLEFRGREMELTLIGSGQDSKLQELTLLGNVEVTEYEGPQEARRSTFSAGGNFLRAVPQAGPDQYQIKVASEVEQAHLNTDGFRLTGVVINFDQQANKAWVDGAGSIHFRDAEVNLQPGQAPAGEQPPPTAEVPAELLVEWDGGMIFDGRKIYFERRVRLTTEREADQRRHQTRALSEALSVELDRHFDLTSRQQPADGAAGAQDKLPPVKARELIFVRSLADSVRVFPKPQQVAPGQEPTLRIANRVLGVNGEVVEQQQIAAQRATIDGQAGTLLAEGPGFLAIHQSSRGESKQGNPLARFGPTDSKEAWSLVRVNFEDQLELSSDQRQMDIRGRVRMVYRPVADWQTMLDPDSIDRTDPTAVKMTCQQMELAQWQPRGTTELQSEMIASGNVRLTSQQLESTAHRISYQQASDLLVIEGSARSDANLWFRKTPQQNPPHHVVAETIRYRVQDQSYEIQGLQNGRINGN